MQCRASPLHQPPEPDAKSQSLPESTHFGPFKLGDASPRLVEAKAATNGPYIN